MPETPDILRLKACPHCGYDLAGLPREHACPECGLEYSYETFDLCGTLYDIHATRWWLPLPLFAIGVVVAAIQVWIGAIPWIFIPAVVVVGLVISIFWIVFLRFMTRKSRRKSTYLFGPDRVLGPRQFDDYEWTEFDRVGVICLSDDRWRISVRAPRAWWRVLAPLPVDLVVKGSEMEISAVEREIARRIEAAKGEAGDA